MSTQTSRLHTASMPGWRLLGVACLAALALTACEAEEGLVNAGPEDTFTQLYNTIGSKCASCHAPAGPSRTAETEQTQDWSFAPERADQPAGHGQRHDRQLRGL